MKRPGSGFGIRHLQCFLLFGGLSIAYALRVNLSVAIVAMTDSKHPNPDHPNVSVIDNSISRRADHDEIIKLNQLLSHFRHLNGQRRSNRWC